MTSLGMALALAGGAAALGLGFAGTLTLGFALGFGFGRGGSTLAVIATTGGADGIGDAGMEEIAGGGRGRGATTTGSLYVGWLKP